MSQTPQTSYTTPVDVLIIGSGPGGLSAATSIARLMHTTIVFSTSVFRNRESQHMHNVLTWDHKDPSDFRAAAKRDLLARYNTTSFVDVGIKTIKKAEREDGATLFEAVDDEGKSWWGRKIILATGITDVFPAIEGYESCWVKGIFHCLFCHGYEDRGASSVGVLAIDDCAAPAGAMHISNFALRLSRKVTIYTNGVSSATSAITSYLSALPPKSKSRTNISINSAKILQLKKLPAGTEVEVVLEDGERKVEGWLAHKPVSKLNGDWVEQLGLETTSQGFIRTNVDGAPFNETSVKGVFAVGDCALAQQAVAVAISTGLAAAVGVCGQLEAED